MRLLVALTEVFRSDGGIPMFNRALLRALSEFCAHYHAAASVLVLNDAAGDLVPRYLPSSSIRFRGCRGNKAAFVLGFLRAALGEVDLAIIGHVNLLPLAGPLALLGRPYFLIAHGIEAWQTLPAFSRTALRGARSVLAVSDYTRQRLSRENAVRADRWRLFPNTLDPFFAPAPAEPAPQPTLLSVARLDSRERGKGIENVLEVLPRLRAEFPTLRYVVVGRGEDQPRLEERARALGVQDCVRFAGYLAPADLARAYAACDVFVLPSVQEGFGIVFLEAMAHAKPVVSVRAGGIPEVVTHGETGLLVDPGDPEGLAAALAQLLSRPERRQRMGAAGRRRLEEKFSFGHFRRRLAGFLVEELPGATYRAHRQQLIR
ncbi:MAG: glycosyltransferase family 4 protein [Terriglobia bacterium]